MSYNEILDEAKERMDKALAHLQDQLKGIRTSRASSALVDNIRVDYYGTLTPISQLASVSIPEPRQIVIKPFDASAMKDIEKAILAANMGVTPSNDGKLIRLNVPPLSEESRKKTVAKVKELAESQRVAIRNVRREANKNADAAGKEGLTEDDVKRLQDEVQKATKAAEKDVDAVFEAKSKEIMEI